MPGSMPFTHTMVSICVNHFRVKFAQNSQEIHIHSRFTCVLACGRGYEFCANFAPISHEICENSLKTFQFAPGAFVPWNHAFGGL